MAIPLQMANLYKSLVRPLMFSLYSETAHECLLPLAKLAEFPPIFEVLAKLYQVSDPRLEQQIFGLNFKNPLGLAAGFDKQCLLGKLLTALGFGHLEIGSLTRRPQVGNPKPRLFRLEEDRALINRMGFNSHGMDLVLPRLERLMAWKHRPVVGLSITKNREIPVSGSALDQTELFKLVQGSADYIILDVSCPNTPDAAELQQRDRLIELFQSIHRANTRGVPVLSKLSPDLSWKQLDEALEVCLATGISGIIATNTTLKRQGLAWKGSEVGGLSGAPIHKRALEVVGYVHRQTAGKLPIIGVGGVFSGHDAYQMICAGASLVQIYTALVYEGPGVVGRILRELSEIIEKTSARNISELVGSSAGKQQATA